MDKNKIALLLVDMQNDILHANGAYGRAKIHLDNRRTLFEQLMKVTETFREIDATIISTNFTLIADTNHNPLISNELGETHPFLNRGDFQHGKWGHQLVDELAPANYIVNKIASSAFYMSYLDWLLKKLGTETLLIGGMSTNESVASTLRDAHTHGYKTILLEDGCAAFDVEAHKVTLNALRYITEVKSCKEVVAMMKATV